MRLLVVLLAVLAGVGGAAWLLLRDAPESPPPLDAEGGESRTTTEKPDLMRTDRVHVPRIGVGSAHDRSLSAVPEAGPWRERLLRITRPAGKPLTGKALLEAVSAHLYVRTRDEATLRDFEAATFEVDTTEPLPLLALEPVLRRAGYTFEVKEPIFMVHRFKPPVEAEAPR